MTSHRHESHCDHDVKVCAHCDVAYCTKCSKEWGAPCPNVYPTWTNPLIYGTTTINCDLGDEITGTSTASDIDADLLHSHN